MTYKIFKAAPCCMFTYEEHNWTLIMFGTSNCSSSFLYYPLLYPFSNDCVFSFPHQNSDQKDKEKWIKEQIC